MILISKMVLWVISLMTTEKLAPYIRTCIDEIREINIYPNCTENCNYCEKKYLLFKTYLE